VGEWIGRIKRIDTDFFLARVLEIREKSKKSVSIRPIRLIRSPIVSPLSKAETADFPLNDVASFYLLGLLLCGATLPTTGFPILSIPNSQFS
jgi:hypothetical protein